MAILRHPKKINLLFAGHDFKFLTPLIERCQASELYDVRLEHHQGHHLTDTKEAERNLAWANVIFCEWALGNAVWYSHHKRDDQRLLVRLHLQEMWARERLDFIYRTDWSRVDKLVLITQHIYDWMRAQFPVLRDRAALVYNPIDATGALAAGVEQKRQDTAARHTLGFVGMVPARKRIDLAVAILQELLRHDDAYTLRIKGNRPEDYPWMHARKSEMEWYDTVYHAIDQAGLRDRVFFDPHGPDMPQWYARVGHILSVSDFEGSHQAVAEGMAAGCVPAIRNWTGADRIYPPKYVASTVATLADMIRRHTAPEAFAAESAYAANFSQTRFDNAVIGARLESLILQACHRPPNPIVLPTDHATHAKRTILPTFLILAYIPPGNRGGYRIRVEQEIKALVQAGCTVHLACLIPHTGDEGVLDAHARELAALGAHTHFLPVTDFFAIDAGAREFAEPLQQLVRLIDTHAIDVLHAEALYCGRLAALAKPQRPAVLFSIDWHGVIPEEERMNGAHENRIRAMERTERKLLRETDLNVFVSHAMRAHYDAKYGDPGVPHVLVPCCVSDERFLRAAPHATPDADDTLVFAYAGTMAGWQCGREMVALFAALHRHDARCRFLLLVPQADHPKVHTWATEFGLPAEAFTLTEVPHDEVPRRLRAAHVGVLLRRDDPVNRVSSPTKFGEYLAAGLPVLMTDCVGDSSALASAENAGMVLPAAVLDTTDATTLPLAEICLHAASAAADKATIARRCMSLAYRELHWEPNIMKWLGACGQNASLAARG
ncbi:MAG: hypothetical protein PWP23_403 [Candidatus Sumerlaeota bacterium]|nr:hypothetical protein [Candidatus Sumerlaeota bacterium]